MQQAELRRLNNKLKQLGFGETEAVVYMKSLELGPATVQEMAKKLSLNRVTVHSVVERLLEKGFLTESRKKTRRLIVAAAPKTLFRFVEKKKTEAEEMSRDLSDAVTLLEQFQTTSRFFPAVRFYEGTQGFQLMLEETLEAKNDVLVFSYVPVFEKLIGREALEKNIAKRAARGIRSKLLFPPCEIAEHLYKKRGSYDIDVRLTPKELTWNAAVFMWNETIALASFKEGRLTTTFIDNKDIADMLRIMHCLMWGRARLF